ncbi:phosphoglycerate mutase family protein [Shewanella chilikensis]|uniref:phosphoglycerate mutase family protein n=1 Tax=Shewanella chilikensis TaxID=558541 RepID=UPI001F31C26A|nr:phosphoglycerate mutase family protein [Shewanella chilikensis]MCE9788493.1 histidine phosphatase family protein [Shewanella chilikensis]
MVRIFLLLCLSVLFSWPSQAADTHQTIFLVRHAEKAQGSDPGLTAAGKARAEALAETLQDTQLQRLISSEFRRTQETLAPIATAKQLRIEVFPAKAGLEAHISAIADAVKASQGNVLIAGHSNTVPVIIKALGGPLVSLDEQQYDQLFILTLAEQGPTGLVTTHFGSQ